MCSSHTTENICPLSLALHSVTVVLKINIWKLWLVVILCVNVCKIIVNICSDQLYPVSWYRFQPYICILIIKYSLSYHQNYILCKIIEILCCLIILSKKQFWEVPLCSNAGCRVMAWEGNKLPTCSDATQVLQSLLTSWRVVKHRLPHHKALSKFISLWRILSRQSSFSVLHSACFEGCISCILHLFCCPQSSAHIPIHEKDLVENEPDYAEMNYVMQDTKNIFGSDLFCFVINESHMAKLPMM